MVELERILTGKLAFEQQRWPEVEELLVDLAAEMVPAPEASAEAITGDPADDLILACAVRAGVDVLVSGDHRHLLPVGERRGVRVITPQALLAELRGA
jgi:predicted nucleic acid-binding protein